MPDLSDVPMGCALAFDFGQTRIGVAQGSLQVGIAHPIATVTGASNEQKFAQIGRLIEQWQPEYVVVGLPLNADDGSEHEMTALAKTFGHRLNGRFRLPVYWVDERFTSLYAEELLKQAQVFGKKNKAVLDQVAAQAILQSFFDGSCLGCFNGREHG